MTDDDLQKRLERLEARANSGRWWRRATLGFVIAAIGLPFAADALGPVPNSFSSGDVISASEMNENFSYLQNAITAVEGKVPSAACSSGQISRFNGTSWVCSGDNVLTTSDPDLTIAGGAISMSDNIVVDTIQTDWVDANVTLQWNNSVSNGTTEMSVFVNDASCNATTRGRIRVIRHEDIGNSTDLGDGLCFCQQYVDRTPATDVTSYSWVCLYPQSDGD